MNIKKLLFGFCLAIIALCRVGEAFAQDQKLIFSGFSEVRFRTAFGETDDPVQLADYLASGADEDLVGETTVLNFSGFNLNMLGIISEKVVFQGELNFHYEEEEFVTELLRAYIDYRIQPKFKLQAGQFLSPIGYLNQNQRIYGYLNYSIAPREMVNEQWGFIPLSMVGLKAYGTFEAGSASAINYQVAWGGARRFAPHEAPVFQAKLGEDHVSKPGFAGSLEFLTFLGESELRVGISGYHNPLIESFVTLEGEETPIGEEADEMEEDGLLVRTEMELSETGFAPYIRYDAPKFQLMFEYHTIKFKDEIGTTSQSEWKYSAYSLELVYKTQLLNKSFYPYVRYDARDVDEGHPYYGLHNEGDHLHNTHAPTSGELIFGAALDVVPGNRIKIEYGRFIEGPFPANVFKMSTAFAF